MRGLGQLPAAFSLTGSALHTEAIINDSGIDRCMMMKLKSKSGVNPIATTE
jgi:hypothetical protein